jgi:hypothetical protein
MNNQPPRPRRKILNIPEDQYSRPPLLEKGGESFEKIHPKMCIKMSFKRRGNYRD